MCLDQCCMLQKAFVKRELGKHMTFITITKYNQKNLTSNIFIRLRWSSKILDLVVGFN